MGAHLFFCEPAKWIVVPKLAVHGPRFSPTAARPFFVVILRAIFSPRTLAAQSVFSWRFSGFEPQHSTVSPVSRARGALRQSFFLKCRAAFFFLSWRFPLLFFPGVARPFFRKDLYSRHNPVYPASKLAALRPLIFPRLLRGRFFARAPCYLDISFLYNPTPLMPLCIMVWPCFAESPVSYLFLLKKRATESEKQYGWWAKKVPVKQKYWP